MTSPQVWNYQAKGDPYKARSVSPQCPQCGLHEQALGCFLCPGCLTFCGAQAASCIDSPVSCCPN